jgi:hypothetical protein
MIVLEILHLRQSPHHHTTDNQSSLRMQILKQNKTKQNKTKQNKTKEQKKE